MIRRGGSGRREPEKSEREKMQDQIDLYRAQARHHREQAADREARADELFALLRGRA